MFKERGQCFFIFLSCSIPTIIFYYFSLSLLSVYMLVLWGYGLRTDRMYITLSRPYTAGIFLIIIIIIIIIIPHTKVPCHHRADGSRTSNVRHGFNFHCRDLKFSDIVSNTIMVKN